MAFTVTVTRGYTMVAGVKPSVDDWNAGFLPSITVSGAVGSSDIADDAITLAKLNPNILLGASLLPSLELADRLLIGDSSVGDNAVATFQTAIQSLFTVGGYPTAIPDYPTNLMLFYNVATAAPFAMNIERWLSKTHEQLTELTATEHDDTLIVRDVSKAEGVQVRKVSLRNVLPDVIAAQTVNNPTQVVVDTKGRVTSISGTEGADKNTSGELTLPTTAGTAGDELVWAHGLTGTPMEVHVWLKCTDAGGDAGYAQNDIIDASAIKFDVGTADLITGYVVVVDATNVTLIQPNSVGADPWVVKKDDGSEAAIDTTKWKAIIRARL